MIEPLVVWDLEDDPEGNVVHIAEHGITQDEVEEVVQNPDNPTVPSDASGNPLTFGWPETGRYLAVVWEHVCADPRTSRPITAFDAPPPAGRRHK